MAPKSGPPAPTIGYPEQRRGLTNLSGPQQQQQQQQQPPTMANQQNQFQQNQQQQPNQQPFQQQQQPTSQPLVKPPAQLKTPCSGCQRELDQQATIKCIDCGRLFCSQCTTSTIAPDGLVSVGLSGPTNELAKISVELLKIAFNANC